MNHQVLTASTQSDRHSRYAQNHLHADRDARDDNVTIGSILKRSATARRPGEKHKMLARSTSNANIQRKSDPVEHTVDLELQFSVQRAWALLEADNEQIKVETKTEQKVEQTETLRIENIPDEVPLLEMNSNTGRIQTVKTLNTRVYIDDANNHKSVQLTNLLTSAMVIQSLKKKGLLDQSNDWTLFEIAHSHLVERPLREWEIVLDIMSYWEPDSNNALLIKKYPYHHTLIAETILQKTVLPMHGWLTIEYKKGKWQKRYCFIKDNAIHHAKDKKASSSSVLCPLAFYDVYTLLQPLKTSPTAFVFAIRAQDKVSMFEKEGDYIRFMATEDQEEMKNWVLSIRQSKSQIQHQHHPNRVANPLAPISLEEAVTVRRQKTLPRSESTRKLERVKSKRTVKEDSPLIDCSDPPPFIKGSLLAKDEDSDQKPEESNTLIHIDDKIKFSKGSLLAKKEGPQPDKLMRSKSVRELSSSEPNEKKVSLRRKPTGKKPTEITLLQLDDTPERFHSRELHGRHVKPLLNFDTRK
ncbi:unnamed protein product [Rhizopus stolonifer]